FHLPVAGVHRDHDPAQPENGQIRGDEFGRVCEKEGYPVARAHPEGVQATSGTGNGIASLPVREGLPLEVQEGIVWKAGCARKKGIDESFWRFHESMYDAVQMAFWSRGMMSTADAGRAVRRGCVLRTTKMQGAQRLRTTMAA